MGNDKITKRSNRKPNYVIFENVANITSKAFKNTLALFKQDLTNLGYTLYDKVLNAIDYGVPQTRKRYFLVAILDKNEEFSFIEGTRCTKTLLDYLERDVDEKYYLTTNKYKIVNNKIIFNKKNNPNREYEVDLKKYNVGGVCGKDKNCKFAQSSRVFSQNGYAQTLTANNTSDNCKILVEEV